MGSESRVWKTPRRAFLRAALPAVALLTRPRRRSLLAEELERDTSVYDQHTNDAVVSGLRYLAASLRQDGSIGESRNAPNTAVRSLAGMAWLAEGSVPEEGAFGNSTAICLERLLDLANDDGLIHVETPAGYGPMYGHGFATLFLAETLGMSRRGDLREHLSKAVRLIIDTQNGAGGWRYQPRRSEADISVTACQMLALRAARNAGLSVPADTIDRGIGYIKGCQNEDGGFRYMTDGGASDFPRTAAAVTALMGASVRDENIIQPAMQYLRQFLPGEFPRHKLSYYYYGHYYAAQAFWQIGGESWRTWYAAIRDELLSLQQKDGRWRDEVCDEYGTAMACLVLQTPIGYLPIFLR